MPRPFLPRPPQPVAVLTKSLPLLVAVALASCSQRPADSPLPTIAPAQWGETAQSGVGLADSGPWWRLFANPTLDQLQQQALDHNQDIKAALARLAQARAEVTAAESSLLPSLTATGSDTLSKRSSSASLSSGTDSSNDSSSAGASSSTRKRSSSRSISAGLTASYEVDLWGSTESQIVVAEQTLAAKDFTLQATRLSLTGSVAEQYLAILTLEDRLSATRRNLLSAKQTLSLTEKLVSFGQSSALELAQQRESVASIAAKLPTLELSQRTAIHALAVLLGEPPSALTRARLGLNDDPNQLDASALDRLSLPKISSGLPSDLLFRRPDIRSAEASLRAANANIGVARAALLPSLTLTGSSSLMGTAFSSLGGPGALAWSLAGQISGTVFDNGRKAAAVDLASAQHQELLATYLQTVLNGLKDSEDALAALQLGQQQLDFQTASTAAARDAFRMAQTQYREGATDYLTVLDSQRTLLTAEDSLAQSRQTLLLAAVSLCKALGGTVQ